MRALPRSERGSVIPEFVMVLAVLLLVVIALVQTVLALHVRSILQDSAAEGARRAALMGSSDAAGAAHARALITSALAPSYATTIQVRHVQLAGIQTVRVDIAAALPLVGLLGPGGSLTVSAHAAEESQFLATPGARP